MDHNYYSGGFAELVNNPTPLTYSFLKSWFTGKGSVGKAMKLLGLPFEENQTPILEFINGELLVNLKIEEQTLYKKTVFHYKLQKDIHQSPQLTIDLKKIINPTCILNTSKTIFVQSKWISQPQEIVDLAKKLTETIPAKTEDMDIENIDNLLGDKIWPVVIAVGLVSEFYSQLVIKESGENAAIINTFISARVGQKDWFFSSFADQQKVKRNEISFSKYLELYGLRADKDYELTAPRWHEIPDVIKNRIESFENIIPQNISIDIDKKNSHLIDTSIQLQLVRSLAKQKTLLFIDLLRNKILQKTKSVSGISSITRKELIKKNISKSFKNKKTEVRTKKLTNTLNPNSGKGMLVSQGKVTGTALHVINNDLNIPKGTVGIFPNASPEFAPQYPKCEGLIFLKGGQTSHGAIVAREFGIPAIIDNNAASIKNGAKIELNSTSGEWQLLNI